MILFNNTMRVRIELVSIIERERQTNRQRFQSHNPFSCVKRRFGCVNVLGIWKENEKDIQN